ncbi:MAG: LytTR family transcriptional regulator [Chitinophagaceae bacterium]|nr:LytTR family transcriptional regulator [Chitinophagaceae bacterium]
MNNISIATNKGISLLCLQNIIRIQSISNYSKIYFADKSHPLTVAKVLHWFEDHLPAEMFLRTHRTHLVNRDHIINVVLSSQKMQLSNGEQIGISKRRKQWVKQRLCA